MEIALERNMDTRVWLLFSQQCNFIVFILHDIIEIFKSFQISSKISGNAKTRIQAKLKFMILRSVEKYQNSLVPSQINITPRIKDVTAYNPIS